jgi:1-phosphofructokinase family hexose kinase
VQVLIAGPNISLDRTIEVERVLPGHVHRSLSADVRGGGKGVNVARALGCAGIGATVVGLVAGRTGAAVAALLDDEGIAAALVKVAGETRSCLTVLDPSGPTVFNESGPGLSADHWRAYRARCDELLGQATLLVVSGSFPPGAPDTAAAELVGLGRKRGVRVLLDVSRAQLGPALEAGPYLAKPNLAEAEQALGLRASEPVEPGPDAVERARRAALALLERGPGAVVVSIGAAGAVLASGDGALHLVPPAVGLVNPVGAGDSMTAGIAAGLLRGAALPEAVALGTGFGAASCETLPAGLLDARRASELFAAVELRPL